MTVEFTAILCLSQGRRKQSEAASRMFGGGGRPTFLGRVRRIFYPDGGWRRAAIYLFHRMRRIKDTPSSIAKGVFVGTLVSFTPLFGLHFLIAPLGAWALGGNVIASLLAVLVCNPLTFPFIAAGALSLGTWMIGADAPTVGAAALADHFVAFGESLWVNFTALFSERTADWAPMANFVKGVFLPYLAGGTLLGIAAGAAAAIVTKRVVTAYQRRRKESAAKKRRRVPRSGMASIISKSQEAGKL